MKLNECRRQNKRGVESSATKAYAIKVAIKLALNLNFNYNSIYDIISYF